MTGMLRVCLLVSMHSFSFDSLTKNDRPGVEGLLSGMRMLII